MPNHCNNVVTIVTTKHPKFLLDKKQENLEMWKIVPLPLGIKIHCMMWGIEYQNKFLRKQGYNSFINKVIRWTRNSLEKFNTKVYGYESWYEFRIDKWGTKWDTYDCSVSIVNIPGGKFSLGVSFQTAWSPPLEYYNKLIENEYVESVEAYYAEPGMAFCWSWVDWDSLQDEWPSGFYSNWLWESIFSETQELPVSYVKCESWDEPPKTYLKHLDDLEELVKLPEYSDRKAELKKEIRELKKHLTGQKKGL